MNIVVGVGEYILPTHNTKNFEDLMGGLNPSKTGYTSVYTVRQNIEIHEIHCIHEIHGIKY